MKIKEILDSRYTVKKFDNTKKISDETMKEVEELLRMSPSSVNMQPWKFTIASTKEGREKIAKSTEKFGFNTSKILDASHVIVFSANRKISEEFLTDLLAKEEEDGRYPEGQFKEEMDKGRRFFLNFHAETLKDEKEWLEKQVYLNAGHFALGARGLGLDSVIMEGFDPQKLDEELNLSGTSYGSAIIIAIGYRSEKDFNASAPKSRLSTESIITKI